MIDELITADSYFERLVWLVLIILATIFGVLFCWTNTGHRMLFDLYKIP